MAGVVATAHVDIEASAAQVWAALTDPRQIEQYMFGSHVETDWQPGSPIVWRGEFDGKPYEDKGEILEVEPERRLSVTHFSPLSGQDDVPENYHTLTYSLDERGGATHVSLSQDNNADDAAAEHAQGMWAQMLAGLKQVVEGGGRG
jgi:uncharacterized protein YndB with AHSA1/START domain